MTPRPLGEIRLRPNDHLSALWWLGLLLRRPKRFLDALKICSWPEGLVVALCLCLHSLPYILILIAGGRLSLIGVLGLQVDPQSASGSGTPAFRINSISLWIAFGIAGAIIIGIAVGIAVGIVGGRVVGITVGTIVGIIVGIVVGIVGGIVGGIVVGIAVGIAVGTLGAMVVGTAVGIAVGLVVETAAGIAVGIVGGIAAGIAVGIVGGIYFGIIGGIAIGIVGGMVVGTAVGTAVGIVGGNAVGIIGGIAFGIAIGIVGGTAVGIAFGIAFGIAVGLAFGLAGVTAVLRCFYYFIHPAFVWPHVHETWYRFHPIAWDDLCAVQFPRMDRLLTALAEHAPEAGMAEIERLIDTYPSQRMAALRARTRLIARESGRATDLKRMGHAVAGLPEGDKGFLKQTQRLSEMVGEIVGLQARLDAVDRPVFREPLARLLRTEIENFQHRVSGFHEPLASEFRAAAAKWLEIADRQLQEARTVMGREPTPQIFRAGDPVNREQEAFVPRNGVVGKLEQQVMLSTGCPGIVLYGRRRMGKSTVLSNLASFLPPSVRVVNISMQKPEAFASLGTLIALLAESLRSMWPDSRPPESGPRDLTGLSRLLAACNDTLGAEGRRLILAFDEYENIDRKIGEGVFPEDLLALIRESIQSHRNLTWAFAGSHEIEELRHAPWTSYLVSARTIEVPPFTEAETRLLLTEPLKFSTLWAKIDPSRPRPTFSAEFWGPGGIERIHAEAAGWPHLVQLIAETIVDLLNDEGRCHVDTGLFECALDESIVRGHNVLYELMRRESSLPGEWEYLSAFRKQEAEPPPEDDAIARSLRRRLLVVEEDAGGPWRLRVPLMRRWLVKRG